MTNLISSLILFAWLLVGIVGGAKIINDFGLLSYEVAALVIIIVVTAYIFLAGFKAVILTDVIQSFVIFVLLVIITFSVTRTMSLSELLAVQTGGIDIGVAIGFFLFGALSVFSYSNMFQLSYAAKNKKKIRDGIVFSIIPIFIAGIFLLLIGLFMAANSPGLDSSLIFTEALKTFLPASLLPLGIVLFFAGIMSSADTNVYAISSHYVMSRKDHTLFPVRSIRIVTIVLMIITAIISLIFRDIVDVSIFAGGISLTLSFAIIYLLFNGRNPRRFIGSVFGGLLGLIIGIAILGFEPEIALPVLIGGLLGLLWNFKIIKP